MSDTVFCNVSSHALASVDCVPLVPEHAPVEYAASRMDDRCEYVVYEHDLYFDGKPSGWIKFPN